MASFRLKAWLLLALFVLARSSAPGQGGVICRQRIVVNVRDQQGKLVPGLQPASFQGSLRAQPVRILSDKVQTEAPRVVLLVDISGSVDQANHNFELAQFAAGNFVAASAMPHVALVLFSDHIVDTLGFDVQPKEMLQKLANLNDGRGGTALFDSLMYSARLFDAPKAGDAVYVISDGVDNHSKFHLKDVEQKFLSSGIRLFCFILWRDPRLADEDERTGYMLRHLAEVTGGSIANVKRDESAKGREWLNPSLLRAYDTMRNFYELEVELPGNLDTGHQWELQVVDEHGKRRKDVVVTYARNLVPCAPASSKNK